VKKRREQVKERMGGCLATSSKPKEEGEATDGKKRPITLRSGQKMLDELEETKRQIKEENDKLERELRELSEEKAKGASKKKESD
jgi:hypothetical protein